jgi:predicted transcriptional regulator
MADNPAMYRVTIKLSPELYAQLQARGRHGQPLAAIVREAIAAYLTRQPTEPQSFEELAMTAAAIAAKLDGLQAQVEDLAARVETLAASGPPPAADTLQPRTVGGQRKLTPRPAAGASG